MSFKKIIGWLWVIAIVVLSALILLRLFFEDAYELYVTKQFVNKADTKSTEIQSLSIVGLYEPQDLNLNTLDPSFRFPVSQIYEALVTLDDDLGVRPNLAVSWGEIDDKKWQFRLRRGVLFHDGSLFTADDVLASFERMKKQKDSNDIEKLLSAVDSLEKIDDYTLHFKLAHNDPSFLMKISFLMIGSAQLNGVPNGTGKFTFVENDEKVLKLKKYDNYWGRKSGVDELLILKEGEAKKRLELLKNEEVDIAARLPVSAGVSLDPQKFSILSLPRLEMFFLIFNSSSKYFEDDSLQLAIKLAVDREGVLSNLGDSALPLYQFVPRGVLGLNPDIDPVKSDLYQAGQILKDRVSDERLSLKIHTLIGATPIADHLRSELANIGIDLMVEPLKWGEAELSLAKGEADLYLLSWKFDVPDVSEFLKVFVHSKNEKGTYGSLNSFNYKNPEVDKLIESSFMEADFAKRSKIMQQIMQIIVEDDPFGVPILEIRSVYGYKNDLVIRPNLNGTIDLSKVISK